MDDIVALVPMKSHSERIPNKNIKEFNGKPLLYWILNTLKDSRYIKKIAVNTDSKKISKKCLNYFPNIKIIERPKKIQGDFVSMNKIIKHDIGKLNDHDYFLQTHATNPLLRPDTIDKSIKTFFDKLEECFDSLFSVNRIQTRCYTHEGKPINHEFGELKRTQDLNPIYKENSNIYIFSRKSFRNNKNNRIGRKPYMFKINRLESIDIDEKKDFILAEKLHNLEIQND